MPNCFELANCPISDPLEFFTYPYFALIGDWIIPLVWGIVLGLLYIRTTNAPMVGIVGAYVLTLIVQVDPTIFTNTATGQLFYWGVVLTAVGFASSLYYLIRVRIHSPA